MPTINDYKKKALNDAGYSGDINTAEWKWLKDICSPYVGAIPDMWRYILKDSGYTGDLISMQNKMLYDAGYTSGSISNKWYQYWKNTPLSIGNPVDYVFSDGTDGFYFDFSKTDRLFQNLRNTPADDAGENIYLALDSSKWGGRAFGVYLASRTEEADIGAQSPSNATGSQNAGGWDITATGDFAGVLQTISGVAGETFVVDFEWSGNNEARQLFVVGGGVNVSANSTAASGSARLFVIATSSVISVKVFLNGSIAGDTIFIKINSIKRVEKNHGLQATTSAQPKWQTGGLARFDGSDDCLVTPLTLGATANTFMAKVTVGAGAAARGIMGFVTADRFNLSIGTGGVLQLGYGTNGAIVTGSTDIRGTTGVATATHDASNVYLYWNGSLIGSAALAGVHSTSVAVPFGCYRNGSTGVISGFFPGDFYHALAIKKALTAAEIAAITNYWNS